VATSTVGQLRAISGLVAVATALVIAVRPPRAGLRRSVLLGLFLLLLGTIGSATATSFPLLALAQVPIGMGIAFVLGGALAAADRWALPGGRARLLSWTLLGQPAAWIVGMPLVGLVGNDEWRLAWLVPAAATVVAATAVARRRGPETPEPGLPLAVLRADPPLRRWLIGECLALSAWAGTLIYCGALFIESYDVSVTAAGFILGGVAVGYVPGNALFRRRVEGSARPLLFWSAAALAIISVPFGAVRTSVAVSFAFVFALAFLAGGRTIAGSALGLMVGGDRKMGVMSLRTAALQFGYLIGGGIGGLALDFGGYTGVGITFSVFFAASAFVHRRVS
jgi:predicted MFS family arabinose efflux permease